MFTKTTRLLVIAVGISLMGLLFAGCGGGGGGGGESITWNGADTPAVMDTMDPVGWARDLWENTSPPGMEDVILFMGKGTAGSPASLLPMDVPADPRMLSSFFRSLLHGKNPGTIAAPMHYDYTPTPEVMYGNISGTATMTFKGDSETGAIYLSVVAGDYADTSEGYLIEADGTYILEGQEDDFEVIFRDFNLARASSLDPVDFMYDGIYEATFSAVGSTDTMTGHMDLAMEDHLVDTSFWFHDWDMTVVDDGVNSIVTGGGRLYIGDVGYIDFLIDPAMVNASGDDYPTSGAVKFTAGSGRWAKLEFIDNNTYRVTACTDGDGTAEFDSGDLNWT